MRAIKKLDNYRMYKVGSSHELWYGKYNEGAFVGYISDPDNFEMAIHYAEETAKYEMKFLKEEINEMKEN